MSSISVVNSVRSFLASNYMFVEEDWINGFVEFTTENSENSIPESELKNLAREQWLLNDLKNICPGSLPSNLVQKNKTVLTGRYVLQVNAAFDIGTPAYQQYLKFQKINMENVEVTTKFEDKVPCHRMIKLSLTDGTQDISAIEYRPIRNLSCDITPGCKILIKGPVECRRGILLLKECSIELLGGEVQEIIESNSLPGLLSAKLNLPMIQVSEADPNKSIIIHRNTDIPIPHAQMPPGQTTDEFDPSFHPASRPVARVTGVQLATFDDDIDIDQFNAIEEEFSSSKRPSSGENFKPEKKIKISTQDYLDDMDLLVDEYLMDHDDDIVSNVRPITKPMTNFNKESVHEIPKRPLNEINNIENCIIEAPFEPHEVNIVRTELVEYPIAISKEPYIFIKQINELISNDKERKVFHVKAQIYKVLTKLLVDGDGWSLKCTLLDGTGSLDAKFTSAVLSKLIGYTPQEMYKIKKEINSKSELREKALNALKKAKETFEKLYCIMELTILEVPTITNLTPFDSKHVDALEARLQETCL